MSATQSLGSAVFGGSGHGGWRVALRFAQCQAPLRSKGLRERGMGLPSAPLMGLLRDETGDRLTPSHMRRKGRVFRDYISNRLVSGGTDPTAWQLPASALEKALIGIILGDLETAAQTHAILMAPAATTAVQVATDLMALASKLGAEGTAALPSLLSAGQLSPPNLH